MTLCSIKINTVSLWKFEDFECECLRIDYHNDRRKINISCSLEAKPSAHSWYKDTNFANIDDAYKKLYVKWKASKMLRECYYVLGILSKHVDRDLKERKKKYLGEWDQW